MSQKISFPEWVDRVEKTGRGKAAIAEELKVKLPSLYRYLAGERIPDRKVMNRITAASGGLVDVSWFYTRSQEVA